MGDRELHETGETSKKETSARPVTSSDEQMTGLDMKCCFCQRKSSTRSYLTTRRLTERIDDGDIPRISADRPSIEIVEIVRRTVWVEKGSTMQLKDLLESLVGFVEDSHKKTTAAGESDTKLLDHGPACIIHSGSLKEEPQTLERSECKRTWQLDHVGGNPAATAIGTKLEKVPSSESKATELSRSMKIQKSKTKCDLIRHGDKPPTADKALQLPEVTSANCKDSEPSTSMMVQTTKTDGHLDSGGHNVITPHGTITESEDIKCKLPGLIQVKESCQTHSSDTHAVILYQSSIPASPADQGGISQSVKLESINKAGGVSFSRTDLPRSLKADNKPNLSKKKRSSSSGGENGHQMTSPAADTMVTQLDVVVSSIPKSVEPSLSVKAKELETHWLSSSGGDNGHGLMSISTDRIVMELEDAPASGAPDPIELPPSVEVSIFMKGGSISSPDENTCGKDTGAADGILTKLEEKVCEYSSQALESRPALAPTQPEKNPSSNVDHAGENADGENGSAEGVVDVNHEPVLVDSSMPFGIPCPVKAKKPKKKLPHNRSGEILQHKNNPAVQDFIRELKKQCAGCEQKLLNSSHSVSVRKPWVKRCSNSGVVGKAQETTTHLADGVGKEPDDGAACAYSKFIELSRSQKIKKPKQDCRHESGTKNVDGNNILSADNNGVGLKRASRNTKSSEVSRPRKANGFKHISVSGGQNALQTNSTLAYDGVVIKRRNSTCSSLQSRGATPFREIHARKFSEKRKQDDNGDYGHGRSIDAYGANVPKPKNHVGALADLESTETRPASKKQLKKLKKTGSQDCAGETANLWEVAVDEGNPIEQENGLLDAKSPTSRRKLKGSKRRHRSGCDSSSPSGSDGGISQTFDFKGGDTPMFLIPSREEYKKKVRFVLPEEGEIAEEDEEGTMRSPRDVHNIPETRFGKLPQAGEETIKKCVDDRVEAEEGEIVEEDEERTKRSPTNVHNIPETLLGKFIQAGDETIKKCVDNSVEERDGDNTKGNYNEARGAGLDIAKCVPPCPVKRLNSRPRGVLQDGNPEKWSEEEHGKMRTLLLQYAPARKKIGRILDRPAQVCMEKGRSLRLTPVLKTGPGTQVEQDQLQSYALQGPEANQKLAKKKVDRSQGVHEDMTSVLTRSRMANRWRSVISLEGVSSLEQRN